MGSILELTLALVAAVGVLCLGWVLFGKMLTPMGELGAPLTVLVKGEGDGSGLEHSISALVWLRGKDFGGCPVLLVDAGLDAEGRQVAEGLCRRWPAIEICRPEDLPGRLE